MRLYPADRHARTEWFNPAAFSDAFAQPSAPQYRFGDSQRNMLYGPNFSEWDAGVLKDIKIAEGTTVQINTVVCTIEEAGSSSASAPAASAPAPFCC